MLRSPGNRRFRTEPSAALVPPLNLRSIKPSTTGDRESWASSRVVESARSPCTVSPRSDTGSDLMGLGPSLSGEGGSVDAQRSGGADSPSLLSARSAFSEFSSPGNTPREGDEDEESGARAGEAAGGGERRRAKAARHAAKEGRAAAVDRAR